MQVPTALTGWMLALTEILTRMGREAPLGKKGWAEQDRGAPGERVA